MSPFAFAPRYSAAIAMVATSITVWRSRRCPPCAEHGTSRTRALPHPIESYDRLQAGVGVEHERTMPAGTGAVVQTRPGRSRARTPVLLRHQLGGVAERLEEDLPLE